MADGSQTTSFDESMIRLQVELEYTLDDEGLLVPYVGSTERARFILHCHTTGCVCFFRHDLPLVVREELAGVAGIEALDHPESVKAVLAQHGRCGGLFLGRSGVFARRPTSAEFPDVVQEAGLSSVLVGGVEASVAWSVRENAASAELAVETSPQFRRRGYGRQVAAAWAHHVMGQGKVAFYSYADGNVPSKTLARSLGVVEFSHVAAYE